MRLFLAILIAGGSAACTAITFTSPQNGSTQLQKGSNPIQVNIAESGTPDHVAYYDLFLDNLDLSAIAEPTYGGHRQLVPGSNMFYVPTGPHTLSVGARDTWGYDVSAGTSFSVANCPLCYMCPVGSSVDPVNGQCCDNGICDTLVSANFGIWRYSAPECQQAIASGSSTFFSELDCVSSGTVFINASGLTQTGLIAPKAVAVMFQPYFGGTLSQIQVPVGLSGGANSLNVWITDDTGGHPGTTVFESWTGVSVRPQPLPYNVMSPVHIFSTAHPLLAANTRYWLVIGAQGANTSAQWNLAINQADSSIPGARTYLWNTTNSNASGPWTVDPNFQGNNQPQLRPAFEIDARQ